jgi:hypothetical protein
MATGMDMMLEKMLGINPKDIQAQAQDIALKMQTVIQGLQMQLDRIENNQKIMYAHMVQAKRIEVDNSEPINDGVDNADRIN